MMQRRGSRLLRTPKHGRSLLLRRATGHFVPSGHFFHSVANDDVDFDACSCWLILLLALSCYTLFRDIDVLAWILCYFLNKYYSKGYSGYYSQILVYNEQVTVVVVFLLNIQSNIS